MEMWVELIQNLLSKVGFLFVFVLYVESRFICFNLNDIILIFFSRQLRIVILLVVLICKIDTLNL